ncbi:MAG: hypothetical protein CL725_09810 [Chloroflexi bacterium]|nr:hypothetical protein [Chloroflexota bacterium]
MKFDWTRMHEASVDEQLVWLRAWEAQLQAHITRQRRMLDAESSVSGELLVMQRERLLKEIQTVIIAAETRANDLECQLSSLRIAIGCQQLLS